MGLITLTMKQIEYNKQKENNVSQSHIQAITKQEGGGGGGSKFFSF